MSSHMFINRDKLSELWVSNWSASDPVAENIKYFYPDEYQRYYTLPEAKRYADNAEEEKIILSRYNTLLDELTKKHGNQIIVIVSSLMDSPNAQLSQKIGGISNLAHWKTIDLDPDEDDPAMKGYRQLYFTSLIWSNGLLDELLKDVSKEEVWGVIIAPEDLSCLYHPYDGGIDLVLKSSEEREYLSAKYSGWFENDLKFS